MGIGTYPLTPGLAKALTAKPIASPPPSPVNERKPQRELVQPSSQRESLPARPSATGGMRLALQEEITACQLCSLAQNRQGLVLGAGAMPARLMLVGDFSQQSGAFSESILFSPEEDALLTNMLRAIGLSRDEVYSTNTLKCCPLPQAVPPEASIRQCVAYLHREIALVRPQIICAMGDGAVHASLERREPVSRLRGKFYPYKKGGEGLAAIRIVPTYHPRLLLAHPEMKRAAWQDLQLIQKHLAGLPAA